MSTFTENKILKSVEVLPEASIIQVLWITRVTKTDEDGTETVISEANSRCAYSADEKAAFLADIPEAANYVAAVGWE